MRINNPLNRWFVFSVCKRVCEGTGLRVCMCVCVFEICKKGQMKRISGREEGGEAAVESWRGETCPAQHFSEAVMQSQRQVGRKSCAPEPGPL